MFCMAESVCETVNAHKVLSHWNYLLHFGICSIFPKGSGSEYNKTCCHEKNTGKPGNNIEKQKNQMTENGGKWRENGGKGWENG